MPTQLPPLTAFCHECGWKKACPSTGDVVMGPPKQCPRCGHPKVQLRPSSLLESAMQLLTSSIKK
ncbi:hypothetical protein [uncultured Oceanisphaera sp.]|uniref:hypothetical protein n=1 Tax=uncultured Oceanisphaera sp. TaxID=353858 RepID=UPI002621A600|nr:hypothetical protein [uncultured Oceanisphaera sp.]